MVSFQFIKESFERCKTEGATLLLRNVGKLRILNEETDFRNIYRVKVTE